MFAALGRRRRAEMRWLQNPNQSNVGNLNNARREAIGHFKKKKREFLKDKINELDTNSKNESITDLCRSINDFKKGYQLRTNIVKDEKGDLAADSHSVLAWWRNHFFPLLNVHGVNDVRQTEIHTAASLAPEPSAFGVQMAIEKLKSHKSPGIDQIPADVINEGGRIIRSETHKLLTYLWNKEELHEQWKGSVTVPIYKKGDKTDCSNYRGISLLSAAYKILSNILLSTLTPYAEEIMGNRQCGGQLRSRILHSSNA
jgi:hypothetical protein